MERTKDLAASLQTEEMIERGHIDFLNANRAALNEMVTIAHQAVTDGNYDENKAFVFAYKLKHVGTELEKKIRPIVEDKLKGAVSLHDCDLKRKDVGVTWDFSGCGDTEWEYLSERAAYFAERQKAREALLKTITKPTVMIIEGEEVTILPPVRLAKDGIEAKLK